MSTISQAAIFEDSGVSLMARITGNDAENITQADVTGITCKVFDVSTGSETPTATPAIVVADVVYDTLQTDARWTTDTTGYNFRYDSAASLYPTGDHMYRVEFLFDPVSGEDFFVVWRIYAKRVWGS